MWEFLWQRWGSQQTDMHKWTFVNKVNVLYACDAGFIPAGSRFRCLGEVVPYQVVRFTLTWSHTTAIFDFLPKPKCGNFYEMRVDDVCWIIEGVQCHKSSYIWKRRADHVLKSKTVEAAGERLLESNHVSRSLGALIWLASPEKAEWAEPKWAALWVPAGVFDFNRQFSTRLVEQSVTVTAEVWDFLWHAGAYGMASERGSFGLPGYKSRKQIIKVENKLLKSKTESAKKVAFQRN